MRSAVNIIMMSIILNYDLMGCFIYRIRKHKTSEMYSVQALLRRMKGFVSARILTDFVDFLVYCL